MFFAKKEPPQCRGSSFGWLCSGFLLNEAVQQGQALAAVQLADGLGLDLADTLAGDAEIAAHFLQRAGTAIVQAKAQTERFFKTFLQKTLAKRRFLW